MGIFSHDVTDDLTVTATFPEDNPFGLVVNGQQNSLLLHLQNHGSKNYTLVSASSSFHDPTKNWALVRNATALRYNVPLVSGANFSAPYTVHSEYRPGELGLTVWVNLVEQGSTGTLQPVTAYNQTVSVVEPPASWLDPSLLFLWLVIGSALLGGAYAAYQYVLAPEQTKKTKTKRVKAVVVKETTSEYPEVKPYEEDWIPAHHLKSKDSKTKKRDGRASGGEELSGGDVTSGAESGPEGKIRKRKGKKN